MGFTLDMTRSVVLDSEYDIGSLPFYGLQQCCGSLAMLGFLTMLGSRPLYGILWQPGSLMMLGFHIQDGSLPLAGFLWAVRLARHLGVAHLAWLALAIWTSSSV